jgi:AhpD family alkylhydroperoxidase
MEPRMKNPVMVLENANPGIQTMMSAIRDSGLSADVIDFVGLRVWQMNNCELCIGLHMTKALTDPALKERIEFVLDWKRSKVFTGAERAALELAEAITELKDHYNSVQDELWQKIENYFSEKERAALVLAISAVNMFTRVNVATRQETISW